MRWLILPAAAAVLLAAFYRKKKLKRSFFLLFFVIDAAGCLLMAGEQASGGRTKVETIARSALDSEGSVPLEVETDSGERYSVEVAAPERQYTDSETEALFDRAESRLDVLIRGKNRSFDRVERNLNLVTKIDGLPVTVEWYTDRPELIDFDGTIHAGASEQGTAVLLTADLSLRNKERTYTKKILVFPPKEAESVREEILKEADQLNKSAGYRSDYRLPDQADGKKLTWYRKNSGQGIILCAIALIGVLLGTWSEKERKEQERAKRTEQMERDYPEVVSKMQLYLSAGMSMRAIFGRLSGDYRRRKKNGAGVRFAFEEISRCAYRMENGVTEADAYEEFGKMCGIPCYRSLSLMMTQNLKKGGAGLLPLLEREVQTAFETRKRRARADGEKITVKLLLPLIMELSVVIILIIIPAFLTI